MYKEYVDKEETLNVARGRIDINQTIKPAVYLNKKLVCNYDEFSENTLLNQIIKTALISLMHGDVSKKRKLRLKKHLFFFKNVDVINHKSVKWKSLYNKSNSHYKFIIYVCRLALLSLIPNEEGNTKEKKIICEENIHTLYEHFIFEYYKRHYSDVVEVKSPTIQWTLDDEEETSDLLPTMKTDIVLYSKKNNNVLIIDAKYYTKNLQERFGKQTVKSAHLYQIFSYAQNMAINEKHLRIAAILLYAKTDGEVQPELKNKINGLSIGSTTLDLTGDFSVIREKFESLLKQYDFL